jgi:hypothetical protein
MANVTYQIGTEGDGAYGSGCFRITARRIVQNLPVDSCMTTDSLATQEVD